MPVGKIDFYTIFFNYANFRLPLSTFLIDILRHYRINISQLPIIAAAKVSHFEILCRVYNIEPTVGLFRCFYVNSKNKGWMSFNPFPKSTEFSADDYAVLVAHPTPFQKFSEPFLCLIRMSRNYTLDEDTYPTFLLDDGMDIDLFAFIHVLDPTKVIVTEQECAEGEAKLLDSTVGRVVPLLLIASARVKSDLEASVERLFDEGGSADQGNFVTEGGHDANVGSAVGVRIIAAENVTVERPKRSHKERQAATDASGSSHPPKKLEGDFRTYGEAATNGKSPVVLRKLLASNMLNVEACVAAVETLLVVTSLITNDAEARIDSFIKSVTPPPVMTEVVTTANVASIPSAPAPEAGTKVVTLVHALMFLDSDYTRTVNLDAAGSFHVLRNELSMVYQDINFETLYEVFVPRWNVSNDTLLDDHDVFWEFINHLAPSVLFAQIREIDYHHLFTEFNVGTARQACLNLKVRMQTKYCLSERRRLESECEKQADLLKVFAAEVTEKIHAAEIDALKQRNATLENEKDFLDRRVTDLQSSVSAWDLELEGLNDVVSSLRSQKDGLVDQVHALETTCSGLRDQVFGYEQLKEQIEEFQDAEMNVVNERVAKLDADLLEIACHLEEKIYPHILTTISGWRWLLTHGMKLFLVKCLNSLDYLTVLGAAISRAIKHVMQSGLTVSIDHGKGGRNLTDFAAHNPDAKADFNSALQRVCEVDFPLLAELKSYKDASVEDIMNLLRLEGPFVDAPEMSDLQPDVKKLRVPIRSVPVSAATTTTLSTTFSSASSISPIYIEGYKIADADGLEGGQKNIQGNTQGNAASFATVKFEKEELDTTLECDPPC
nr:hypothetical protein [Tanacetum cinerariifolium]